MSDQDPHGRGHYRVYRQVEYSDGRQWCPTDGEQLECQECYVGGGSYYWDLKCLHCGQRYEFDTYSFTLRKIRDEI